MTLDLMSKVNFHNQKLEPWKVTFVDTGENTMTGGRIKKIYQYIKNDDYFHLTYGDGVADINLKKLERASS